MKTCGECAWFMPEFRLEKNGTETLLKGGVCRRVAWNDGDGGPQLGWLVRVSRACPAFEQVPVEVPENSVAVCLVCRGEFSHCNHTEGFEWQKLEARNDG